MTYQVGGIVAVRPQAIAVVDDTRLVASNSINGVVIALLGPAASGPTNTPLAFTSATDAARVFTSGDLVEAIRRAYSPGITPGAYQIVAVRLDGDPLVSADLGVAGTARLKSAAAADVIALTGTRVGLLDNLTSVAIAANPTAGSDITVTTDQGNIRGFGVGAKGITLHYVGTGTVATVAVTATGLTTTVTDGSAPITADQLALTFANYPTIQKLVDAINANAAYTASVTAINPAAASATLDGVSALDIKAAKSLRADLQAQIDWLNTVAGAYLAAARVAGAVAPAAPTARIYLAGGDDPSISTNSWTPALAALEAVNVDIVVPISGDASVHTLAVAHCEAMSDPRTKHERRAIVGGAAGETVEQTVTRALALNSSHAQLVYPGLKDQDASGALAVVPPYLVAAQKAGMSAGLRRGYAATFQFLKAAGIERNLSQSDLNTLEENGVLGIEFVTGRGFRIVHDQTTYLKTDHIDRREFSTALVLDQVVARLREVAELRIGQPATPATQNIIAGDIVAECGRLSQEGLLVGSAQGGAAFRNLVVSVVGTQVTVGIEVAVALPMNFVGLLIVPTSATGLN